MIKLKDLKQLLETTGLEKVHTYMQSGNMLFESDSSEINKSISSVPRVLIYSNSGKGLCVLANYRQVVLCHPAMHTAYKTFKEVESILFRMLFLFSCPVWESATRRRGFLGAFLKRGVSSYSLEFGKKLSLTAI